jgi:hypothetical protein
MTKAVIVTIMGEKHETRRVNSYIGKYVHFSNGSSVSPFYGICDISGKAKQDQTLKSFLRPYYEGVLSLIRNADSVWIFGPGTAKGELEQHRQDGLPKGRILGIESMG